MANALAMDKVVSKRLFVAGNVSTPRFTVYERSDLSENITKEIIQEYSLPVVIKASTQGSSIGVSIVENVDDLKRAIEDSFKYSEHILVEEFIPVSYTHLDVYKRQCLNLVTYQNNHIKKLGKS